MSPQFAKMQGVERFELHVPDAALLDLRRRLGSARLPEPATTPGWEQGVPLERLEGVCRTWAESYDWRATERRLNAVGQFRAEIDGLAVHFLHVRSPHPDAQPLILTHGWPGSVVEFLELVGPLSEPEDPADAFHLVIPSLPGYGFSGKPAEGGWGTTRIARAWAELMARLGYASYGAGGSDWGTTVCTELAKIDREHLIGIHVPPLVAPDPDLAPDEVERRALALREWHGLVDAGYSRLQATRPQTVGYALVDSPVALCAWIYEKYQGWMDCDGDPENVVPRNSLLDNLMLYWLPATGASSARLYREDIARVDAIISGEALDPVDVPAACTAFPRELQPSSRRWAERRFTDLRYWSEPERGGHFAAWERPEAYAAEVRGAFRALRG